MNKYGQLIKEARKPENRKTGKPETLDAVNLSEVGHEPDVNLSIKVSAARRRHWAAEAKRRGVTLTAAITDALSAKFGEPG